MVNGYSMDNVCAKFEKTHKSSKFEISKNSDFINSKWLISFLSKVDFGIISTDIHMFYVYQGMLCIVWDEYPSDIDKEYIEGLWESLDLCEISHEVMKK